MHSSHLHISFVFSFNICLETGRFGSRNGAFMGRACFKAVKLGVTVVNGCINSKGDVFLDDSGSV